MICDLSETDSDVTCQADVVVVGAGLAGLMLAHVLSNDGLRIVLVESGSRFQAGEFHPLNEVELTGTPYSGATSGRFRCLGGTSTRWGGALLPFQIEDFRSNLPGWPEWPITIDDVSDHLRDVETLFSLSPGSYESDAKLYPRPPEPESFARRSAKWPQFSKRNIANLLRQTLERASSPVIWLNATTTELMCDEHRFIGLSACDSVTGKRRLAVSAGATVLAAGAIETTRLMLLARMARPRLWQNLPIGLGFHDHISGPIADLVPVDRKQLIRAFAFQFQKGEMRNWRLELRGEVRAHEQLPGAFAHVAFTRSEGGAFGAVRSLLQSIQRREVAKLSDLAPIARELPWFVRAAFTRVTTGVVLPPDNADFELHLVTEQSPLGSSRIELSEARRDMFGLPLARINWELHTEDLDRFQNLHLRLVDEWQSSPLMQLAQPLSRTVDAIRLSLIGGGGVFHPAGSTRMGVSPATSVLDRNLAPHDSRNVWALSTAAFPTCGGANPSLTLLLLAIRLAKHLVCGLRTGKFS